MKPRLVLWIVPETEELPASGKIAEALIRCVSWVPCTLIEPGPQNGIGSSVVLSQKVGYSRFSTLLKEGGVAFLQSSFSYVLQIAYSLAENLATAHLQWERVLIP